MHSMYIQLIFLTRHEFMNLIFIIPSKNIYSIRVIQNVYLVFINILAIFIFGNQKCNYIKAVISSTYSE